MLKQSSLDTLKAKKNLLAFSAGVDSSALFFLLHEQKIDFDIAIVNYNTREQSLEEVQYAQDLAKKYNLTCHTLNAPQITTNFEAKAREIRYAYFEKIITEYNYDTLLTAHHLGDRFEWMLMQFCKGAGCVELAGMREYELRENYALVRPLLHVDKSELLTYLKSNTHKYFEDSTNKDENILRNSFRKQHAQPLLQEYLAGIKKSFEYIDEDRALLAPEVQVHSYDSLKYFLSSHNRRADMLSIDSCLKKHGYLTTASEKNLLKKQTTLVLGRKYLVTQINNFVFIAPFEESSVVMSKEFKEECRILKIETKLRPYFYANLHIFTKVKELLRVN